VKPDNPCLPFFSRLAIKLGNCSSPLLIVSLVKRLAGLPSSDISEQEISG
jgi:hypothetical protein